MMVQPSKKDPPKNRRGVLLKKVLKRRSRNLHNIKRLVNDIEISVGFFRFRRYSETEYFRPKVHKRN
jgi:hypothetical protein